MTTGWRYHADQDKWTFPAYEVAQNERGFWSEVEATVREATREGRAQGGNEP